MTDAAAIPAAGAHGASGLVASLLRAACFALAVASVWSITAIEAAALVLVPLGLAELLRRRRSGAGRLPPAHFVWPIALVLATALLAALANPDRASNLLALRGHYRLLLPLALLPALELVDRRRWLAVLAGGVILSALYGAVQFNEGVDWLRADGFKLVTPSPIRGAGVFHAKGSFSHHLTFAGAMLVHLVFFLALFLDETRKLRWLWLATAVAAGMGVVLSMGRSGWIGAAVGSSVLLLRLPRRIGWPLLAAGSGAALLLGAALWSGVLARSYDAADRPALLRRLLSTSYAHDKDRVYLWEAAWSGFLANPILGIGTGNDRRDFAQWRHLVAARHGGHRYLTSPEVGAHNVYLQLAYETGALGLAAHLIWMGTILLWCRRGIARARRVRSLDRGILFGCAAGLVGSMAAGIFETNFADAEVQTLLLLLFGLALHAGLELAGSQRAPGPGAISGSPAGDPDSGSAPVRVRSAVRRSRA